jgi:hypothetical protein
VISLRTAAILVFAALCAAGCATPGNPQARPQSAEVGAPDQAAHELPVDTISTELQREILALDPEHVTEHDVRECLSAAPAPRIINIHGGLLPIKTRMNSFAVFLIGMGYPEDSLRNPEDGSFTYGYYDRCEKLVGEVAWYYEHDGLRPMLMGHSLGGMHTVRVLHKLAGDSEKQLAVWNPISGMAEQRFEITDPLTGEPRPVVGLQVSYATSALAGGLGRLLPKQWDMNGKLREIPDSVEEFTGFQKGWDVLGGDFLGYGSGNEYRPVRAAVVRNVRLPSTASHTALPDTRDLLEDPEVRVWISQYRPGETLNAALLKTGRILWAAEVWYGIKKHWVMELQRLIRARYLQSYGQ